MSVVMKHHSSSSTEQNASISGQEEVDMGERPSTGAFEWALSLMPAEVDGSYHRAVQKELDLKVLTPNKLRCKDAH